MPFLKPCSRRILLFTFSAIVIVVGSAPLENTTEVMDPAFEGVGHEAGLKVWRVENFELVPFDKVGQFYTGDSYVVLHTKENNGSFSWDIHFWLGNETSQDEMGTAAIKAVELDDVLGGVPVQYREVQGAESSKFLSYFKKGIRYLPGGIKSGFTHVDPDAFEKRLFHVKGRRNVRVKQVRPGCENFKGNSIHEIQSQEPGEKR
ncbi:unnamed protein product, partial [Notodromas monacha]